MVSLFAKVDWDSIIFLITIGLGIWWINRQLKNPKPPMTPEEEDYWDQQTGRGP